MHSSLDKPWQTIHTKVLHYWEIKEKKDSSCNSKRQRERLTKGGGVTSKRAKFIHFAWVGAKVRIMDRSRASAMGNDVSDWFGGAHMTLRVGPDTDDLDEIEIVKFPTWRIPATTEMTLRWSVVEKLRVAMASSVACHSVPSLIPSTSRQLLWFR